MLAQPIKRRAGPPPSPTSARGLIVQRFEFSNARSWVVEHNLGTTMFTEALTDSQGFRFIAPVRVVDANRFEVHLTEATSGFVDVAFYVPQDPTPPPPPPPPECCDDEADAGFY